MKFAAYPLDHQICKFLVSWNIKIGHRKGDGMDLGENRISYVRTLRTEGIIHHYLVPSSIYSFIYNFRQALFSGNLHLLKKKSDKHILKFSESQCIFLRELIIENLLTWHYSKRCNKLEMESSFWNFRTKFRIWNL